MRFELFWMEVRKRFMPRLSDEKQVWEKAKRKENIDEIVKHIDPRLNILDYDAAYELLSDSILSAANRTMFFLRPLFLALKDDIVTATKETNSDATEFKKFKESVLKLVSGSPRDKSTIETSRWRKLSKSSGSDGEPQGAQNVSASPDVISLKEEYTVLLLMPPQKKLSTQINSSPCPTVEIDDENKFICKP